MKKIILLGLRTDPNIGDGIISDCTEKLVDKIIQELGFSDMIRTETCDIRGLDFRAHLSEHEKRLSEIKGQRPEKKGGIAELFKRAYCRVFPGSGLSERRRSERQEAWRKIRIKIADDITKYENGRRELLNEAAAKKAAKVIDEETAAVIVVGGGLIKYGGYQQLAVKLAPYLRLANEKNIPVMFNAVGVEGYDENNEECRLLKEILNLPCIKTVTTRDDIRTLREKYITGDAITTKKVPCPACWVSELYPIDNIKSIKSSSPERKRVIGLGMARGRLFLDNGSDITPERLDAMWNGIIDELERRGYEWKVFTNGYGGDDHYAVRFLEKRGYGADGIRERLVPAPESTRQFVSVITSFDGIIAVRLHAAITAYSYGIPAAEPVWNIKQTMFGEWIGVPQCYIPPEELDPAVLADRLEALMDTGYPDNDLNKYDTYDSLKEFISGYAAGGGENDM